MMPTKPKKDLEAAKETITKTETEITNLKVEHKKTTEEIVRVKKEKDAVTATLAKRNDQLIDAVKRARDAIKILQPVADIDLDSIEKIEAPVQVVEPEDTSKTVPEPVKEQQQTQLQRKIQKNQKSFKPNALKTNRKSLKIKNRHLQFHKVILKKLTMVKVKKSFKPSAPKLQNSSHQKKIPILNRYNLENPLRHHKRNRH